MAEANVGTITGKIELDAASVAATLGEVNSKLDMFSHKLDTGSVSVKSIAEGIIGAEAAMKAFELVTDLAAKELEYLVVEGGKAADIRDAFDHLTQGAGLFGDTLLTKVRAGVQGMVEDVDIMKRVNADLAAGLKLSAGQYELIAQASFKLAQAEGIEVKEAFDRVSDAMVTGRTRGIALLTGRIDQQEAEREYATSLGTTADHLNQVGKIEASRVAILASLQGASERLGKVSLNLGDVLEQAKVKFSNFNLELGQSIAESPVLIAGFNEISAALGQAFGGDKQDAVRSISMLIDDVAIGILKVAEVGADAAGILGMEWNAAKVVFGDLEQIVSGNVLAFKFLAEGVAEVGKLLHLPGGEEAVNRIDQEIQTLMVSMKERGDALQKDKAAEEEWAVVSGRVSDKIEEIRQHMIAVKGQQDQNKESTKALAGAEADAATETGKHEASADKLGGTLARSTEEVKSYVQAWTNLNALGETWQDTLTGVDQKTLDLITYYLKAGASIKDVSEALGVNTSIVEADKKAIDAETEGYKLLTTALEKQAASEISLAQTRISIQQSRLSSGMNEEIEALNAKHASGLVSENAYQTELLNIRSEFARRSEALYEEEARNEEDLVTKKLAKEEADLQKSYDLGKVDYADFEATKTALAAAAEDERAKIREQYEENRRQREAQFQQQLHQTATQGSQAMHIISEATAEFSHQVDAANDYVMRLDGSLQKAVEYKKELERPMSMTYDLSSKQGIEVFRKLNPAASISWSDDKLMEYAKNGGTLEQLVKAGIINLYAGYGGNNAAPKFKTGGSGDFGPGTMVELHGKEIITPLDQVKDGLGGTSVHNTFYVNGTGAQVGREASDHIMRTIKNTRWIGGSR